MRQTLPHLTLSLCVWSNGLFLFCYYKTASFGTPWLWMWLDSYQYQRLSKYPLPFTWYTYLNTRTNWIQNHKFISKWRIILLSKIVLITFSFLLTWDLSSLTISTLWGCSKPSIDADELLVALFCKVCTTFSTFNFQLSTSLTSISGSFLFRNLYMVWFVWTNSMIFISFDDFTTFPHCAVILLRFRLEAYSVMTR